MKKILVILLAYLASNIGYSKSLATNIVTSEIEQYINKIKSTTKPHLPNPPPEEMQPYAFQPISRSIFAKSIKSILADESNSIPTNESDLTIQQITLHYADAEHLSKLFENKTLGFLSTEGQITADKDENALWIHDSLIHIRKIEKIITQLDKPSKQIFIKARIINVDQDFIHSLGIIFGSKSHSSGIEIEGFDNLTLPIVRVGRDLLLDATLSALEKEGHARMISKPQLMTMNHKTALIEAGEEVPYQQSTDSGGTSVVFKKAVLRLKVTPEIMPNQQILLHLAINQDQVSSLAINGVPAIKTQQLQTNVVIKNQSTLVLGGIFEQNQTQQKTHIPVINNIPILGSLFNHQQNQNSRQQLLIFVTPIII